MFSINKSIVIILLNLGLVSCGEGAIQKKCEIINERNNYDVEIRQNIDKYISVNDLEIKEDFNSIIRRYKSDNFYAKKIILKNELQDDNDNFDYSGYLKSYNEFERYNSSILSYRYVDGGSGNYFVSHNFIPKNEFDWNNFKSNISDQFYLISGKKIDPVKLNSLLHSLENGSDASKDCLEESKDIITEFDYSNFHVIIVTKYDFQNNPNEFESIYYQVFFTKATNIKYSESYF
ncbi:hypothetical protein G9F32_12210 [Acinetobacter sp. 194]|uniref:hypothetical protein n=1 Tax=Acinetobacter shaoyimingii TaxID=2715164 RepID=UPI001407225A|nr:hypothetical protein [Acinetobacter shaoyimingii]NHB58772.1 hypothetical protein [Acinetobacter shaoyimingii]